MSPSVTPFFFIYHDNCMLSTAPENAAQAVAIKTRHQKRERGGKKRERKKSPSPLCCNVTLQIILTDWKVLWQQYAFPPITQRTKSQAIKKKERLYWLCQTVCTLVAENRFVALSLSQQNKCISPYVVPVADRSIPTFDVLAAINITAFLPCQYLPLGHFIMFEMLLSQDTKCRRPSFK